MQQRVHGKVGALRQVVGIATPRNLSRLAGAVIIPQALPSLRGVGGGLQGIEANADRRFLVERLQVSLEAILAKELAGGSMKLGV
jgi:hypothetical protein